MAQPPSDGTPRRTWSPSSLWRTSKLGGLYTTTPCPGLLLMLSTDLAASLRQELDSCDGLRVEWEAVADGNVLALLHRDAADECQ